MNLGDSARRYQGKAIQVEAVQISKEWFGSPHPNPSHPYHIMMNPRTQTACVDTTHGPVTAKIGDWIVETMDGKRFPVKPYIFQALFEATNE